MRCPLCNIYLGKSIIANVEVDYCSRCYGLWFEEGELENAKDEKDRNLRWLDIDLWKDPARFVISPQKRMCPKDRLPLYEVGYAAHPEDGRASPASEEARRGDSGIRVDVCSLCHGVWLDRGEFKNIVVYLREKAEHRVLYHYARDLFEEAWEIFSGPEMLREEILDFLAILKLLMYKFASQYATLSRMILSLPR